MQHRFRFLGEMRSEGTWTLAGDEALHLIKVLRLPLETPVEVMDGAGRWALGVVAEVTGKEVTIAAEGSVTAARAKLSLEFAIGALKPGAVDDVLPALTELGVDHLHVFHQQDSAKARLQAKVVERWQRIVVQSAKQCKRTWLPEIHQYDSVQELVAGVGGDAQVGTVSPVDKVMLRGASCDVALPQLLKVREGRIVVVAGGEKGLSAKEEAVLLEAGYGPATLGPYVLRAVTAAVAAAATMSLHRVEMC